MSIAPPPLPRPRPDISIDECCALVERLCHAPQLRRSPRLCEFLQYVCKRVVLEGAADLREQEIGEQVFGRQSNYETGIDPIVRVQASHLRRKLAQYFESEGAHEPVILDIPKGGYLPVFRRQPARVLNPSTEPLPLTPPTRRRNGVFAIVALGTVCAVLALCCVWLLFRPQQTKAAPPALESHPYEYLLWSRLFNKGQNTTIVVADAGLGIIQNWTGHPLDLQTYLAQDFNRWLGDAKPPPNERRILETLSDRFYTTGTDLKIVRQIDALSGGFDDRPSVVFGKSYHMRQANTDNVILLGTRRVNPWIELFDPYLNFELVFDHKPGKWHVINRHPAQGEPTEYQLAGEGQGITEGYALVAFLPNLARSGNVLLLSGSDMEATEAAGGLVLTEAKLAPTLERMFPGIGRGKQELPYFEVLLTTRRFGGAMKEYRVENWRRISLPGAP